MIQSMFTFQVIDTSPLIPYSKPARYSSCSVKHVIADNKVIKVASVVVAVVVILVSSSGAVARPGNVRSFHFEEICGDKKDKD